MLFKINNPKHLMLLMFYFPLYLLYISGYKLIVITKIILKLQSLQNTFIIMFSFIWSFQEHCDKREDKVFIWLDQEGRNLGEGGNYANMKWRVK